MFDLSSCEQSLKKICSELEYEQNIVKSLADLAEFLDTTVKKIFEIVFYLQKCNLFLFFLFLADRVDRFKCRAVKNFSSILYEDFRNVFKGK